MWPYERSQDDLSYQWNRIFDPGLIENSSNDFFQTTDIPQGHMAQPTVGARFGSHPMLHEPWFLANLKADDLREPLLYDDHRSVDSDFGATRYLDNLCIRNASGSTDPTTMTTSITTTGLGSDCCHDVSSFLEPPVDHTNRKLSTPDFDFSNNMMELSTNYHSTSPNPTYYDSNIPQSSYPQASLQRNELDNFSLNGALEKAFKYSTNTTMPVSVSGNDSCWNEETRRDTRSAPPSPIPVRRKRSCSSFKQWSNMDEGEQMKVVENLTTIVSTQMDVFEQLEIIRIIKPDAKLTFHRNQFVVELSMLDNHKYKQIRDLLRLQDISLYPTTADGSPPTTADGSFAIVADNHRQQSTMNSSADGSFHSNRRFSTKQEIRLSRQKRFLKLRQRKDRLQQAREDKSGLFAYNETMSVKRNPPDEEHDIDIIG